jgi:NADPH:quinone reductase-like Zn-dependent oxidoreductase
MRAAVIHQTGGPEVLSLEQCPPPEPAEGEVLVRIRAASVNPIEWKQRRGLVPKRLPAVLGSDFAGTVERSRAEGFTVGDEVFGLASSGAYAEYASARAAVIAKRPQALGAEQAAAIPVAGMTAWQALFDRGRLQRGQRALVAGAAGGVGHLAVQFAHHAGAWVIGTASPRNRDFVLGLGAQEFVDYTSQDVSRQASGVNVAFDTVGGETTASLVPTLARDGALVTIANAAPEREASAHGARAEQLVMSPSATQLVEIAGLLAGADVRVEIAATLPLEQISRAHALSEAGHTRGKIVITIGD